jgi:hypothetical protein
LPCRRLVDPVDELAVDELAVSVSCGIGSRFSRSCGMSGGGTGA